MRFWESMWTLAARRYSVNGQLISGDEWETAHRRGIHRLASAKLWSESKERIKGTGVNPNASSTSFSDL